MWKRAGDGPYWTELSEWATAVGVEWVHERNMVETTPLRFGQ